jgi:hypothetical protein
VDRKDVAAPVRLYDVAERKIAYRQSHGREASALVLSAFDEDGNLWIRYPEQPEGAIWQPADAGLPLILADLRGAIHLRTVA